MKNPSHVKMLTGDVNWVDYGALFYRRLNENEFLLVKFTNLHDLVGEESDLPKYEVHTGIIDLRDINPADKGAALFLIGATINDGPLALIEGYFSYWGPYHLNFNSYTGNNYQELLKLAASDCRAYLGI